MYYEIWRYMQKISHKQFKTKGFKDFPPSTILMNEEYTTIFTVKER